MARRISVVPLLFGALLVASVRSGFAGQNVWTSNGPRERGDVQALAISPSNSAVMYAAANGAGVYSSADAGETWQRTAYPANRFVASIAVDPRDPGRVFVAGNGLFETRDGGSTWTGGGLGSQLGALVIDASDDTLFALSTSGNLFRRHLDDTPFQAFSVGDSVWSLVIDPTSPTTMYAGGNGLFKSVDRGANWTRVGQQNNSISVQAIRPGNPSTLYAIVGNSLARSTDGGATWKYENLPGLTSGLNSILAASDAIYAATDAGVFRSSSGGSPWSVAAFRSPVHALAIDPAGALFAGTGDGVFRSGDHGARFAPSNQGLDAARISAVALDPTNPHATYAAGTVAGMFRSADDGATWTELDADDSALVSLRCLAVDPVQPSRLYAAGFDSIVRSTDAGLHWNRGGQIGPPSSLAIDPATSSLYVGFVGFFKPGSFAVSRDQGKSFQTTVTQRNVYSVLADAMSRTLFVGSDFAYSRGYYGTYPSGGSVGTSRDGGVTFDFPSTGNNFGSPVTALAREPNAGRLYAGTSHGVLWKSDDSGATWTNVIGTGLGPISAIAVDPAHPSNVYVLNNGMLQSTDRGARWYPFGDGLPAGVTLTSLAIEPDGKTLHVGTDGAGVFDLQIVPDLVPCTPAPDHLCLLGTRFRVELNAKNPINLAPVPAAAVSQGTTFGYFSLPALTGDPTLPEVFVKMVDASSLRNGGDWLIYSSLTSVPYTLVVTDTTTGERREYDSTGFCGGSDGFAPLPGAASSVLASSTLKASGAELDLLKGRFRVSLFAVDPHTRRQAAGVAIAQDERFGYFSLPAFTGDRDFPEVIVKMVDATALPGKKYWVFHTGLTSLQYTLTITDTVTGAIRVYHNRVSGSEICGGSDTAAFSGDAAAPPPPPATAHFTGAGNFKWVSADAKRALCPEITDQIGHSWAISADLKIEGASVTLEIAEVGDEEDPPAVYHGTIEGNSIDASYSGGGGFGCPQDTSVTPQIGSHLTATLSRTNLQGQWKDTFGTGENEVVLGFTFSVALSPTPD